MDRLCSKEQISHQGLIAEIEHLEEKNIKDYITNETDVKKNINFVSKIQVSNTLTANFFAENNIPEEKYKLIPIKKPKDKITIETNRKKTSCLTIDLLISKTIFLSCIFKPLLNKLGLFFSKLNEHADLLSIIIVECDAVYFEIKFK